MATKNLIKAAMLTVLPSNCGLITLQIPSNLEEEKVKQLLNCMVKAWSEHAKMPENNILNISFDQDDINGIITNNNNIIIFSDLCDIIGNPSDTNWVNKFYCQLYKDEVRDKIKYLQKNIDKEFEEFLENNNLLWFKVLLQTIMIK